MAFFNPIGYRWGHSAGSLEQRIIANSQVITVGGFVNLAAGFVDGADASERIWGLCVGIVNSQGIPLDKLSSSDDYDGTFVSGPIGTQKYTASSDNQTDKKIMAVIDVSPDLMVTNEPDAAIGTTSSSGTSALAGCYTDLVSDVQVDESNNAAGFSTVAQLVILGVGGDPGFELTPTTHGVYAVMERQDYGG